MCHHSYVHIILHVAPKHFGHVYVKTLYKYQYVLYVCIYLYGFGTHVEI